MTRLVPFNKNNSLLRTNGFTDFYNMLDDFFNDMSPGRSLMNDSFKIDVRENEGDYRVDAELPGVKKEDISVELVDNRLSISVTREENTEEKRDNYLHKERRFGSFSRSVYLADVQNDGITAKFNDGLLEITVPKAIRAEKASRIEIQ